MDRSDCSIGRRMLRILTIAVHVVERTMIGYRRMPVDS